MQIRTTVCLCLCLCLLLSIVQARFNSRRTFSTTTQSPSPDFPNYETKYFDQYVDHFNYQTHDGNNNSLMYKQRYMTISQFWGQPTTPEGVNLKQQLQAMNCTGPIFFYTGNEAPVTDYVFNSGLFTNTIVPHLGGLLIFAEHRYFGESLPFPIEVLFDQPQIGFLSTDQALADYARLLFHIKQSTPGAENCPIFSFGGSYGGMLTTWFRVKYPHIVMGGLAASAPMAFYGGGVSPYAFTETSSATFEAARPGCGQNLKQSMQQITQLTQSQSGIKELWSKFQMCGSVGDYNDAVNILYWVVNGLVDMTMLDYPYPTNYGIPIVAWPVNTTCDIIAKYPNDLVTGIAQGIGSFYNGTGTQKCYNTTSDVPDWGVCCGWNYLACTTVYMPYGQAGIYPYEEYNLKADEEGCRTNFGANLRPYWPKEHWGGRNVQGSRIIFSNGLLDPWHTSGVLKNLSDSLIAIVIPESAHHLDLRGDHAGDPVYVRRARVQEESIIVQWLNEWAKENKPNNQ